MSTNKAQSKEQKTISEKEFNERPLVAMPQTEEEAELKNFIVNHVMKLRQTDFSIKF